MATSIYDIPVNRIDGTSTTLADYRGKVLLIVNVASKCGLTPQYEGLQKLYDEKKDQGLEILGFPANNFKEQEPGTNEEIASFCSTSYGVTFPLFQKISVTGEDRHPLYDALIAAQPKAQDTDAFRKRLTDMGIPVGGENDVLWNFEKFVVGRDGAVVARLSPDIKPDDERLSGAVEAALKA